MFVATNFRDYFFHISLELSFAVWDNFKRITCEQKENVFSLTEDTFIA